MDIRDITKATESTKRLVQDEDYYKYIFKKTEKIVSVVFYVSNSLETDSKYAPIVEDILSAARDTHDAFLKTLEVRAHVAEDALRNAAHTLIKLDSKLRVATTLRFISNEVLVVIVNEIDSVLRGLNKYLIQTTAFDDLDYRVAPLPAAGTTTNKSLKSHSTQSNNFSKTSINDNSSESDRRERIKVVLQAKGEATIKDITDIISDVSSKTIQRELNAMIEDNIVQRQGERRWSKYSLN